MKQGFGKAKKLIVLVLFLAASILSVVCMGKVAINYNISNYLDDSTETKISLDIIEKEFGMTGNIQVMIEDIDVSTAKEVVNTIKDIPNVLTVNFNENDEGYYKDGSALFVVLLAGDEYSEVAAEAVEDIRAALDTQFEGKTNYGGAVIEKAKLREAIESEIPFILAISLILTCIIMLLTSKSWFEPLILLAASGVAVLLNMGTNAIFGEISYITNAVAAILQLALSIDYSIVLLHSYRALKDTEEDHGVAMAKAVKEVIKPVSASALTTIAGLLALLFMSFKIGFDIGIVLMKGIAISAITSLTLLPVLLLIFDKLMSKTEKPVLELKGKIFCKVAFKACKVVVPAMLALIIVCGTLQFGNTYSFTDSKNANRVISDTFGQNNTVVVVYPNGADTLANEKVLADRLNTYRTADGKLALKGYTAYSNTVGALYDVELAARTMGLPENDVKMLLTMYHLYGDSSALKLSPMEFVKYAYTLLTEDPDGKAFADENMTKTIGMMLVIDQLMSGEHTAEEFYNLATSASMSGMSLSSFAINQMYGLYFYDGIANKAVDFETMLDYMIAASKQEGLSGMFEAEIVANLNALSTGIKELNKNMETPLTKAQFQGYMFSTAGVIFDEFTTAKIWSGYFLSKGQAEQETIPFLDLMNFLIDQKQITDAKAVATIKNYGAAYAAVKANYSYEQFLPALAQITTALTGNTPALGDLNDAIQQIYIMYFNQQKAIPVKPVLGKTFVEFIIKESETNAIVASQLSEDGRAKLNDLGVAANFLADTNTYDFNAMASKIKELLANVKSISSDAELGADLLSGIYIKYALANDLALTDAVEAKELLAFVTEKMDSHALLKSKMTAAHREKVTAAQESIESGTDLFVSENYSRMLLSVDLPNESEESSKFVEYLISTVKEVFGDGAHVAGEMVSTYEQQVVFDKDNTFISIFTIISIFLIVMIVFRSISLPVLLVTVIQGAIWICMSMSLISGPMFFMSYIVATCILMGATIDYGILMSTNYIGFRATLDKKEALYKSVAAAMPTVFTSGLILTICGFVVGFVASQTSISSVGILLGKGTLVSIVMITLVLPSVLYLFDGFILKLSMKSKNSK